MAIENLWKALEHGQSVDMITERIDKRKQEKATLKDQLALEMAKEFILTAPQVIAFLQKLKSVRTIFAVAEVLSIFSKTTRGVVFSVHSHSPPSCKAKPAVLYLF